MSHDVVAKLFTLDSELIEDISDIALEKSLTRKLNQGRTFTIQAPAGHSLLTATADDGYRNLRKGNRKLVVWEDDAVVFHGRVWTIERTGDGTKNLVTITAQDPWAELGYDADGRAGRPVRDATGNFIKPVFESTAGGGQTEISGPDLIHQVLVNSLGTDDEGGAFPGEGQLPIDIDNGDFDLDVPPAVDLDVLSKIDWPMLVGDFISLLVNTGVVDVEMRPLDPDDAFNPYHMVELSAVSSFGTDRTASVHFDYWTGSKNAAAARHVEDFSTICNKLYDYLGPRLDQSHWRANITPGSPGVEDLSSLIDDSRERYGGPSPDFGQFMQIRVFDSLGDESGSRPLYLALWNAEQRYRLDGRDMLFITPAPASAGLFEPPADFDAGDLITVNIGSELGLSLSAAQRVYGYERSWDRNGVARVSELLVSADPA